MKLIDDWRKKREKREIKLFKIGKKSIDKSEYEFRREASLLLSSVPKQCTQDILWQITTASSSI